MLLSHLLLARMPSTRACTAGARMPGARAEPSLQMISSTIPIAGQCEYNAPMMHMTQQLHS